MRICRIAGMERERDRERERESKREIERCRPKMHTHRPGTKACCSHCMRSKSCAKVFPAKQTNKCYGCGAAWDQEKKKKVNEHNKIKKKLKKKRNMERINLRCFPHQRIAAVLFPRHILLAPHTSACIMKQKR